MQRAVVHMLVATIAMWVVCAVALWIYAGPGRPPERRELVINRGDAELIAAGENPLEIPAAWSFLSGDLLVLDNRDSAIHAIGPWTVGPGQVLELTLRASVLNAFCSISPSGRLSINVQPRRTEWAVTVLPTVLLGPPLGLVAFTVRRVVSKLDDPSDELMSA